MLDDAMRTITIKHEPKILVLVLNVSPESAIINIFQPLSVLSFKISMMITKSI